MPIDNLGKIHFTDEQIQKVNQALETIMQTLFKTDVNLNAEERRNYGTVKEKNKLLIEKVRQYHQSQPLLQSPEVDWAEFEKDYSDRAQASQMIAKVKTIESLLNNIKILGDYDNYTDALKDYKYAKYKNSFGNQSGYSRKIDDLKVFFPNTGKTKKKERQHQLIPKVPLLAIAFWLMANG